MIIRDSKSTHDGSGSMIYKFIRRLLTSTYSPDAGDGGSKLTGPEMPEWERCIVDLVNAERVRLLGTGYILRFDPDVSAVARQHSLDMSLRQYFNHISPEGEDLAERLQKGGIRYVAAGENIAFEPVGRRTVVLALRRQHEGLMASPGHRENILNPAFNTAGVGTIRNRNNLYTTEVFILDNGREMSPGFPSGGQDRSRRVVVRVFPSVSGKR